MELKQETLEKTVETVEKVVLLKRISSDGLSIAHFKRLGRRFVSSLHERFLDDFALLFTFSFTTVHFIVINSFYGQSL